MQNIPILESKKLRIDLAIVLLIGLLSAIVLSKTSYAVDTYKLRTDINAHQNKITVEREAIIADNRKLQEVKKTGDKAKIEQVTQEINQDIKKRKATIKALYKDMEDTTWAGKHGDVANKK